MGIRYDVNFINPFLGAVMHVLGTMAQVEARPKKPFINKKREAKGDVTGLIGVTGAASGAISLSLSEGAILKIVNNMLFESYTELNDDIADAVGELTNMIAGRARQGLAEQGLPLKASTPTVVVGRGHVVEHVAGAPVLSVPFDTDDGGLFLEVSFAGSEEGAVEAEAGENEQRGEE